MDPQTKKTMDKMFSEKSGYQKVLELQDRARAYDLLLGESVIKTLTNMGLLEKAGETNLVKASKSTEKDQQESQGLGEAVQKMIDEEFDEIYQVIMEGLTKEAGTEEIIEAVTQYLQQSLGMKQIQSLQKPPAEAPGTESKPRTRATTPDSMPELVIELPRSSARVSSKPIQVPEESSSDEEETDFYDAPMLRVKRENGNAEIPTRATWRSAGMDLALPGPLIIGAGKSVTMGMGISIQPPPGYHGKLSIRSSVASRYKLQVLAGIIDEDYRGELKAIFINHSNVNLHFGAGDRLVQLELTKAIYPQIVEVVKLDATMRGCRGLGSSGPNRRSPDSFSRKQGVDVRPTSGLRNPTFFCPLHQGIFEVELTGDGVTMHQGNPED